MKLTPDQRRQRIYEMMDKNTDFLEAKAACAPAKRWFDKVTARLPRRLCSRLREYPGMMYFMHQRMIDAVCQHMRFPDED